jgi:signal transduction histidine kinase
MLDAKPVEVMIQLAEVGEIQAPPSLLEIALGNLVRNAFQYTMRGKVTVVVHSDRVSVIDSGPGMDSCGKGMGLGLTIVERICETMNWQFTISGEKGEGTRADIIFRAEK